MSGDVVHLEAELVGDHRNKFAVRRLATGIMYRISEIGIQDVHVAAVPCDLDRVPNRTLDARARCLILLCNARVKLLCDGIDDFRLLDCHDDRVPQIVVTLDVGGNADLVQNLRDLNAQVDT